MLRGFGDASVLLRRVVRAVVRRRAPSAVLAIGGREVPPLELRGGGAGPSDQVPELASPALRRIAPWGVRGVPVSAVG